jgi:pyruvate/2-oxoglutarate dehydrogenase complex dihydrolipoamide dehydrogenase (E3) component
MSEAEPATVDIVVLGLGPGGEYAARKLAEAGLVVVGVERALVGGECPFWGCTPSKLMVRPADLLAEARRAPGLAGDVEVTPDWSLVADRIREANHDWTDHHHAGPLADAGVRIVRGTGRLHGPGRVIVRTETGERIFEATRGVILNAGTEPARPDIDGLAATPYWTNREVMKVTEVPATLGIIGGGPNGVELAQAFARFGSRVTLLEAADHLLSQDEPEAGEALARIMREEGIEVHTGVGVGRVDYAAGFEVSYDETSLRVDQLLVATGRANQIRDIGLDTVGLDPEAGIVAVDERSRAGERLWAVGDITGRGAFTHVSRYQAGAAVADILGDPGVTAEYIAVSRVVFTDPEVAAVGQSEAEAREAGIEVAVSTVDIERTSRGWIHGPGTRGLIKLVADRERGVLVGATVVAPYGGEVIGMLVTAVHAAVPVRDLRRMHFAYPTFHRGIEAALSRLDL